VVQSGAIIEYLISRYDTKHSISHHDFKQRMQCQQWLFFQTSGMFTPTCHVLTLIMPSGQGPYLGQLPSREATFCH
jgi:glutathione S-transferase